MHFHDKLLKLKSMMYTDTGRDIAHERHALLELFLKALALETDNSLT
jgi:uncharacterized protein